MSDDDLYTIIANELKLNRTNTAIWTRAFAESAGDPEKTKAIYIRYRFLSLKSKNQPTRPASAAGSAFVPQNSSSELGILRGQLAEALRNSNSSSFYSTLGLTPEVNETDLRPAISNYESQVASGAASTSPEFRYAKETLSDPKTREAYDRRLLVKLSQGATGTVVQSSPVGSEIESDSVFISWWNSRKTSVIVGVASLVAVGYLSLNFQKQRSEEEFRKKQVEVQQAASNASALNESQRINNQRVAIEVIGSARQNETDYRAIAESQRITMQRERESRELAMREERAKAEQKREEDRKAEKHRRYWECMNKALDTMKTGNADARCAAYR